MTDACVCVVATRNYAGRKQTSYKFMTMEMYAILD